MVRIVYSWIRAVDGAPEILMNEIWMVQFGIQNEIVITVPIYQWEEIDLIFQAVLLAMLLEMAGPTLLDAKINLGLT